MVGPGGVGPPSTVYKTVALPLSYGPLYLLITFTLNEHISQGVIIPYLSRQSRVKMRYSHIINIWAVSSVVERRIYTAKAAGSFPAPPTNKLKSTEFDLSDAALTFYQR